MTYTIGMVWPRLLIEPDLGVSTYFDDARIFQRSGHHMVSIKIGKSNYVEKNQEPRCCHTIEIYHWKYKKKTEWERNLVVVF